MKAAGVFSTVLLTLSVLYLGNVDIKSATNSAFANIFQNGGNPEKVLLETIDLNQAKSAEKPAAPLKIPRTEKIIISEIVFDPEGSDKGKEYIKLYSPNNFDIDLTGWSLKQTDKEPSVTIIKINSSDQTTIKANSFYLIGFNSYSLEPAADAIRGKALSNTEGTISVLNKEGEIVYSLGY